ncbi:UNVERIFIED_CONTAM: rod shape-determining protein MreC [Acetivibrio alkalicellulosi]
MKFFRKKLVMLLTATLVILIIMGLSSRENSKVHYFSNVFNTVLTPFQQFINFTGGKVEGVMTYFEDVSVLKEENEYLRSRVEDLESEVSNLAGLREKNEELKEALNIKEQFSDFEFYPANVIAKDMGNWFSVFTVDRGLKDKISQNDTVITSRGLVGRIMSPDIVSSKVISIVDVDSAVSARISRTRDLVVVKGDMQLKESGLCRIEYIEPHVDITVGDKIETSGLGGIYPRGIEIGRVKEIRQRSNELNRYAIIEPYVDFNRLEEVYILKSID